MLSILRIIQINRYIILSVIAFLIMVGLASVTGLPVEAVPDISPCQVLVSVVAPSLATEDIEKLVTFPIETTMAGLPQMTDIRSVSRSGVSVVYIQFSDDSDINLDRNRVEERLQAARSLINAPGINVNIGPLTTGLGEIMQFQLKGAKQSLKDLNRLMTWTVAPQLKLVPGVVDVNINGGYEETYELAINPARLEALGVSLSDVYRQLETNNADAGGGWVEHHQEQEIIVGRGLVSSLADFGSIPVKINPNGSAIYFRDLGKISLGARTRLGAVTRDGNGEIVTGVVMMRLGASSNATLAAVNEALPAIRQTLPQGVTLQPLYLRSTLTDKTIATVKENLVVGAFMVIAVLIAVIGDWKASLVIASVIPFSLIIALMGMRWFAISANLLSLGAIDFGMIVDGSLVLIEHFIRIRDQNNSSQPRPSLETFIINSTAEVARPIAFGILIIIMVYLPILTLEDIEGKMFRPMAQTVIMALLASLFYAFIAVPILARLFLGRRSEINFGSYAKFHVKNKISSTDTITIEFLRKYYIITLTWCKNRSAFVFVVTITLFLSSVLVATRLGGEFIPTVAEGALTVTTTRLPTIALPETLRELSTQEKILRRFPEVTSVVSYTGTSAIPTDPMGVNETDSFIFLKNPSEWTTATTQDGLIAAMSKALSDALPGMQQSWSQPVEMRMDDLLAGVRTQIAVSIYGYDLEELSHLGSLVAHTISSVPGAADVAAQGEGKVSYVHVDIDRMRAAQRGVAMQDALDTVEAIGGHVGHTVSINNALISTQIRFDPMTVNDIDKVSHLRVRRIDGRAAVPLGEFSTVTLVDGPSRISRDQIQRRIVVQANVRGRDLSSFVKAAQQAVTRSVPLPPGYRIAWAGQFQNLKSAVDRLQIVVPISLTLIFVLLCFALNSFQTALIVFANLPIAGTGGILALALRGIPFSISAAIGFIALFGVSILNGVVLMTTIQTYRQRGLDAQRASFQAAVERFRPVMATALVASFGFIPMALSTSAGAEVERPLATVVIGGLISSTALTLLVMPLLYARFVSGKKNENSDHRR